MSGNPFDDGPHKLNEFWKNHEEKMTATEAAELDFLRWYAANADFGPADYDVQVIMREAYTEETGMPIPKGWSYDEE